MTISYSGNFVKLLFRWKGSIWRSIWKELFVFWACYYFVRAVYTFFIKGNLLYDELGITKPRELQGDFEELCRTFDGYTKQVPLTFLLGFYVSMIVGRWWTQFQLVSWPDDILAYTCYIWGTESERDVRARYTIARYVNLATALCWRDISLKVRRRFPTMKHVMRCGLITENELELYNSVKTEAVRWQLPLTWIQRLLEIRMDSKEGKAITAPFYTNMMGELKTLRTAMRQLYCYDWVCVPLVYTQVAAIATYGFFLFCLLGRQTLEGDVDILFPFFTTLQFVFYVGWFKVGQDLMRPFGTDDDDVELNYILDRNVQASFSLVHTVIKTLPRAVTHPDDADSEWATEKLIAMVANTVGGTVTAASPSDPGKTLTVLPHTKLSAKHHDHPPKMHAEVDLESEDEAEMTQMDLEDLLPREGRSRLPKFMQRLFKRPNKQMANKNHRHF